MLNYNTLSITNARSVEDKEVTLQGLDSFSGSSSHNSLENYYLTNFAMIQHHKWSLTELEDMMPYENIRDTPNQLGPRRKRKNKNNKLVKTCDQKLIDITDLLR